MLAKCSVYRQTCCLHRRWNSSHWLPDRSLPRWPAGTTRTNTTKSAFGLSRILGGQMPIDYQDDFKTSSKCTKRRPNSFFDLRRCLVQCVHVNVHFSIVSILPLPLFIVEDYALCVNDVTLHNYHAPIIFFRHLELGYAMRSHAIQRVPQRDKVVFHCSLVGK